MTCVCNPHFSRFLARELLNMIFAMGAKLTNRIQMVSRGRFFSHHAHAIVYFDSCHRVTKTRLEGGLIGELVEGLEPQDIFPSSDWPKRSYRHQLETINRGDGVSVIEFWTCSLNGDRGRCSAVLVAPAGPKFRSGKSPPPSHTQILQPSGRRPTPLRPAPHAQQNRARGQIPSLESQARCSQSHSSLWPAISPA